MGVPEGEMPISNESKEISRVLKSEKLPVVEDHRIGENAVLPASFVQSFVRMMQGVRRFLRFGDPQRRAVFRILKHVRFLWIHC